ncbi:MAG: hypothetical protein AAB766_00730 [Patescibacteria group bacterium]
MSREKMGAEQLKAAKEKINTEGMQMEEGEEGGAAVYVGTKEEVTKARQLAETEGRAPDLASYLVMHKKVLANPQEIEGCVGSIATKNFEKMTAGVMCMVRRGDRLDVYYKDSSGDLAKVEIEPEKIASIKKEAADAMDFSSRAIRLTEEQLREKRFRSNKDFIDWNPAGVESQLQYVRLKKLEDEQNKGFAF